MITKKPLERITCQKKIILDYLRSVKTHPSAEIVYLAVKKKLPQISRGTVYRNLKNLKEKGRVLEISSEVSRYDGDISQHSHFFCEKCGKIIDIFQKITLPKIKKVKVGDIKNYQAYFYGTCASCE